MTPEETMIIERLKRTYDNVKELEKNFDIVAGVALMREKEIIGLKVLCTRAVNALEAFLEPGEHWEPTMASLIAELRKAAQ